jgi:hypothetical protein
MSEKDYEKTLRDIVNLVREFKPVLERGFLAAKSIADDIITQKNRSEHLIEQTLDMLLDYALMGRGEEEFRRLNAYYTTINKQNAKEYEKIYKEMMRD